jgi:hypothetical protein
MGTKRVEQREAEAVRSLPLSCEALSLRSQLYTALYCAGGSSTAFLSPAPAAANCGPRRNVSVDKCILQLSVLRVAAHWSLMLLSRSTPSCDSSAHCFQTVSLHPSLL